VEAIIDELEWKEKGHEEWGNPLNGAKVIKIFYGIVQNLKSYLSL
jgi:hypothetical protein